MYDYELEKSLEERQKEELEMNLKRNAINRKFEKKIKLTYAVIALLFVIVVIGFLISRNPDVLIECGYAVSLISFVIIIVVNKWDTITDTTIQEFEGLELKMQMSYESDFSDNTGIE